MTKQYNVDYFQDRKLKYEKNHGAFIHEFMFTEFSNRILGQCNVALNNLQRQLDAEIARAKAEELRIENKAHNELEKVYETIKFINGISLNEVINSSEDLSKVFVYLYNNDNGHIALADEHESLYDAYNNTLRTLMAANNENVDFINRRIDELSQNSLNNFNKLLRIANVTSIDNIDRAQNEKTVYPYASWKIDSNEIETTTQSTAQKPLPETLSDSYNAVAQALHAINELYMKNNTDGYTLNAQGRLVKNDQQTKLISNYNNTLMYITQALNTLAKKVEDLENK